MSRLLRSAFLPCSAVCLCVLASFFLTEPALASTRPYVTEEVSWHSSDARISGTLLVPEGEGPHPTIVLVHGSGPATRETLMKQPEIRGEGIAESFARAGIATLVYDKRGSGESTGESSYTYEQLAGDALGGVRLLRARDDIDSDEVGLWGISEGGWIVPMAASRSEDVAFAIVVSASGLSPARQQLWRIRNNLDRSGVPEDLLDTTTKAWKVVYSLSKLPLPEAARGVLENLHFDPITSWRKVDQPVLAVYGDEDKSVLPAESARILAEALREGGNRGLTVLSFPDADHSLIVSGDGYSYPSGKLRYVPGYLEAMTGWVREEMGDSAPDAPRRLAKGRSDKIPASETPIPGNLAQVPWYGTAGVQIGLMMGFVVVFASAVFQAARGRTRSPVDSPEKSNAVRRLRSLVTLVSALDLVVLVGLVAFVAEVVRIEGLGPPPAWSLLQALGTLCALLTLALLIATAAARLRGIGTSPVSRAGTLLVMSTTVFFVPFMLYWNLVCIPAL